MIPYEEIISTGIIFLQWFGTFWLIIGAGFFVFSRDTDKHLRGFYAYLIGTIMYIFFACILQHWGMLVSQSIFLAMNIYGIYNCNKELNKKKHYVLRYTRGV